MNKPGKIVRKDKILVYLFHVLYYKTAGQQEENNNIHDDYNKPKYQEGL